MKSILTTLVLVTLMAQSHAMEDKQDDFLKKEHTQSISHSSSSSQETFFDLTNSEIATLINLKLHSDIEAPISLRLCSDIDDESWDKFPTHFKTLDLSDINTISKKGLEWLKKIQVEHLNISNLYLHDDDLQYLPEGLKSVDISHNPIGGYGLLHYLPDSVEKVKASGRTLFKDLEEDLIKSRKNFKIEY